MRKKPLHKSADPSSTPAAPGAHAARGRRARVRNRLLAGVVLCSLAVLTAGTPVLLAAARDLSQSQELLTDAELSRQAVSLAHTLADERHALVVAQVAEPATTGSALSDAARSRADRLAKGLRPLVPAEVAERLDAVAQAREDALAGESTPAETHHEYARAIEELDGLTRSASRALPARAADPTADALPDLVRAVNAASATRTLLVAGLHGEGEQRELAALAQDERSREAAALTDYAAIAAPRDRDAYQRTVTGPSVTGAEERLLELTSRPYLTDADRAATPQELSDTLAARTELQRSVLASLVSDQASALERLRNDDLNGLQTRIGLVAGALLLAVAASVYTARSVTRPLAVVRLGSRRVAADPAGEPPVGYTGRRDEFAEIVHSVNALRARAAELGKETAEALRDGAGVQAERDRLAQEGARRAEERDHLAVERDHTAAERDQLAAERDRLAAERDDLVAEREALAVRLAALDGAVHGTFAHHAQRILALVQEQLAVLERLEEHETDSDHLATLFSLDHLAARVRRHGENMLLLTDAESAPRGAEPVPLVDVLRAAISETERYELVALDPPPPPALLAGPAARDISHLLAELLDNAAESSPPGTQVRLASQATGYGELILTVTDEGAGLSTERLAELNAWLAGSATPSPPGVDSASGIGMGLYTVARLAARHGPLVRLLHRPTGGLAAEVTLPAALVQPRPPEPAFPSGDAAPAAPLTEPVPVAPVPPEPMPDAPRTGSGLPLRTPADSGSRAFPPSVPRSPTGQLGPEELRRRLGGFQRGARDGHRDAAQPAGPPAGEEMS